MFIIVLACEQQIADVASTDAEEYTPAACQEQAEHEEQRSAQCEACREEQTKAVFNDKM